MFIKTLLTGAITVSGLWLVSQLFLPILKKLELSKYEKVALSFGFALALISNIFLAISALDLYRKAPLLIAFLTLCILGAISLFFSLRELKRKAKDGQEKWSAIQVVLLLMTAFGVIKALLAALGPEFQPDALMYHLYIPKLYLSFGNVAYDVHNFTSGYGLLPQLVYGVCAALGEVEGGRVVHWSFFVSSLLFVFGWVKSAFDKTSALFATALLSTPHMMGWCAHTANTEYFMTLFIVASIRLLTYGHSAQCGKFKPSVFIAGLCAGFSWASKPIAIGFLGAAFLSFAILNRKDISNLFRSALFFALGVIAAYLPWSVRSFLGTGNPFYPFFAGLFGEQEGLVKVLDAVATGMKQVGLIKGPFALILSPVLLPILFLIKPMMFGGLDPHMGWVFAYVAFFIAPKFLGRNLLRWFVFGSLLVFYLSAQQLRFLLPFYFVLAIFAAGGFFKFSRKAFGRLLILIFPIVNLYPIAKHIGNVWYLDYQVPKAEYFLGRQTKDEFLARYSYGGVYQLKLFADIVDSDKSKSVFSLGGADHLYFWPRRMISYALSPYGNHIAELIKNGKQSEALDLLKESGFDLLLVDNWFAHLLSPLVESDAIFPLLHTGTVGLVWVKGREQNEMLCPEGFWPAWGILDARPAFYAWLAKDSRFVANGVKRVELKVQIPDEVLKGGVQRLYVQIDEADVKPFTFHTPKVYKIELEINACDSKPLVVDVQANQAVKIPAGSLPFFYSAAIRGADIEFCDGQIIEVKKKFWPLSGLRGWEKIIGRAKN